MTQLVELPSPAVYVDLDIAERNLRNVAQKSAEVGLKVRPHIKAHKSVYFAKKQMALGAIGITVAKIAEAEIMADHGIDNIFIAFPIIGEEKLQRLRLLHDKVQVSTLVDSLEAANGLNTVGSPERPLSVLLDIDIGTHRGGLQAGEETVKFAKELQQFKNLAVVGLFAYNGLIYSSSSIEQMASKAHNEMQILSDTAYMLKSAGINTTVLSGGSTPAITVLESLKGITEIRSGNYIYYDVSALSMGICGVDDCAIRVLATVVSTPLPGYATIDAGSKTLTSDLASNKEGYGYVVGMPDVSIVKLNEEHGFMRYDPIVRDIKIGDRIEIIPNHACVLPNLCDFIYGVRNNELETKITIDARGKNY